LSEGLRPKLDLDFRFERPLRVRFQLGSCKRLVGMRYRIRSRGARRSGEILMRKVAALVALLGLAGWALADGALLNKLATRLEIGHSSAQCLARAEPLCPLC